ncbi:DUF4406 domain-containing protein [Hafnia psychrotolerans]|uniref:DUF4406 domain-containing protein n=1 Tax=Hafnia psychrotolerans TaxID=1477018 RepID=A0ABQ1FXZ0_9GAMM|nr:DUF4406 domain-containing protein [Hafnia psychrotolerans]GGA33668.1 hypothetical protein GCM10011328_05630 [Hafnia psychrotolerans]
MKMYIAGPMTGIPHLNRPAFHQAALNLSFKKYVPLNPAILPDGLSEADYMAIGITMLQRADAIYLLPEWQNSAGARAEHALATKLGLHIYEGER